MKNSKVAETLINARKRLGVSQLTLSIELNFSSGQYVSNVERGLCPLSPKLFKYISKRLKIPLSELIEAHLTDYAERVSQAVHGNSKR